MARNKFDVDEVLETPFDIRHLKRSLVYAAKYKKRIAISLILSALGSVIGLLSPLIVQNAIDNYMIPVDQASAVAPDDRVKYIILSGAAVLACIIVSVIFAKIAQRHEPPCRNGRRRVIGHHISLQESPRNG